VRPEVTPTRSGMAEAEKAKGEDRFLIPSTIGEEKVTNPFLRAGEPARAVKTEGAVPVAVFQAPRMEKQVLTVSRNAG
jgi:hydroxyacylglutathione hydrolase